MEPQQQTTLQSKVHGISLPDCNSLLRLSIGSVEKIEPVEAASKEQKDMQRSSREKEPGSEARTFLHNIQLDYQK